MLQYLETDGTQLVETMPSKVEHGESLEPNSLTVCIDYRTALCVEAVSERMSSCKHAPKERAKYTFTATFAANIAERYEPLCTILDTQAT